MLKKYSVGVILRDQLNTMRPYGKDEYDFLEIFLIFGIPLLSPIIQCSLGLKLTENIVSIIVSATSIFAGMLLNLLVLLYSIISVAPTRVRAGSIGEQNEQSLIKQLFANISYAILISALIVIGSLITLTNVKWCIVPAQWLVYYLGANLFFIVGQVLKRFHRLLEEKIKNREKSAEGTSKLWPISSQPNPVANDSGAPRTPQNN